LIRRRGGRISLDSGSGNILVAGFRCRLDFDDRLLSDSGNRISNVRARTKSSISENVRFPKIKEGFTVKLKMIFVDHYFRPCQTP
jgi:hypothetical protein